MASGLTGKKLKNHLLVLISKKLNRLKNTTYSFYQKIEVIGKPLCLKLEKQANACITRAESLKKNFNGIIQGRETQTIFYKLQRTNKTKTKKY